MNILSLKYKIIKHFNIKSNVYYDFFIRCYINNANGTVLSSVNNENLMSISTKLNNEIYEELNPK